MAKKRKMSFREELDAMMNDPDNLDRQRGTTYVDGGTDEARYAARDNGITGNRHDSFTVAAKSKLADYGPYGAKVAENKAATATAEAGKAKFSGSFPTPVSPVALPPPTQDTDGSFQTDVNRNNREEAFKDYTTFLKGQSTSNVDMARTGADKLIAGALNITNGTRQALRSRYEAEAAKGYATTSNGQRMNYGGQRAAIDASAENRAVRDEAYKTRAIGESDGRVATQDYEAQKEAARKAYQEKFNKQQGA